MVEKKVIQVVDSHTEGEPTRVVIAGGPDLRGGSVLHQREVLEREHDWLRTTCLNEPRGFAAMVGAMLCESNRPDCVCGVIFFNNVGYLNSCIHGTIGVVETLLHLGRISSGEYGIETPVGRVVAQIDECGSISVRNVRSYRHAQAVPVDTDQFGQIRGDVAWGGNWFFLVDNTFGVPLELAHVSKLGEIAGSIRRALATQGITGAEGAEIDHIEIFGPATSSTIADSKNYVHCPGNEYDRSPCGTGTSAKLACLFAGGKLQSNQTWRQSGILDTVFHGTVDAASDGGVIPTIRGRAFVTGDASLIAAPSDPFRFGIPT